MLSNMSCAFSSVTEVSVALTSSITVVSFWCAMTVERPFSESIAKGRRGRTPPVAHRFISGIVSNSSISRPLSILIAIKSVSVSWGIKVWRVCLTSFSWLRPLSTSELEAGMLKTRSTKARALGGLQCISHWPFSTPVCSNSYLKHVVHTLRQ